MKKSEIENEFIKYNNAKSVIERYVHNHLKWHGSNTYTDEILSDINNEKIDISDFKIIVKKCELSKTNMLNINNYITNTRDTDFLLSSLVKNPFKFVYVSTRIIISYKKAERIAEIFSVQKDEEKDKAWIHEYILKNNSNNSFFVSEKVVINDYFKYFDKRINMNVLEKLGSKQVFNKQVYYTSHKFIEIESEISNVINKSNTINTAYNFDSVCVFIKLYELENEMCINEEQRDCVHKMIKHNLLLVSGYPGVGKSTIVDIYCKYAKKHFNFSNDDKIYVVAPTGMAVKSVKSKLTGCLDYVETMTIHKLIYKKHENKIKTLIIDESSMINTILMHSVTEIIDEYNCNVIFLGDENQLPPIGIGEPFRYFLSCKSLCVCNLVIINRQKDSQLKETIKQMIEDPCLVSIDDFDGKSLVFQDTTTFSKTFIENIVKQYDLCEYKSKFISPSHLHESGVKQLNFNLQKIYNNDIYDEKGNVKATSTLKNKFEEKTFKVDDLVLLTKNISNTENVNGDFFKLRSIITNENEENENENENEEKVVTNYEMSKIDEMNTNLDCENTDNTVVDNDEMFDNYQLGYCCTIHKTQGSQYENIVIIVDKNHLFQWSKYDAINLLYTAVSRATKRCILLGDKKVFYKALYSNQNISSKKNLQPLTNIRNLIP